MTYLNLHYVASRFLLKIKWKYFAQVVSHNLWRIRKSHQTSNRTNQTVVAEILKFGLSTCLERDKCRVDVCISVIIDKKENDFWQPSLKSCKNLRFTPTEGKLENKSITIYHNISPNHTKIDHYIRYYINVSPIRNTGEERDE